ncbi:MAG: hypothetical protein ABMA64_40200 [Myxococcota bacterium]
MNRFLSMIAVVSGCASELAPIEVGVPDLPEAEDPATEDVASACGDTHHVDVVVTGVLHDADGAPIPDAEVRLEERNWSPLAVYGVGHTDEDGFAWFEATALPIVEGCWGIGPQFYMVVDTTSHLAEVGANPTVVSAWLDGTLEADFSSFSFELLPVDGEEEDAD